MESKECTGCHITKPITDYYIINKKTGRLYSKCKKCMNKQRKEWRDNNPGYYKKWRDNNRTLIKKYQTTPDVKLKRYLAMKARYCLPQNKTKRNARAAVTRAVKKGILPKASIFICSNCEINQAEHYHHHNGYDKEHRLDIVPVCRKCHLILDGFIKE